MLGSSSATIVSVLDPALDFVAMSNDVAKFVETRDSKLVKERPGMTAMRFVLAPIPTSVFMKFVEAAASEDEKKMRAFQASVQSVKEGTSEWVPTGERQTPAGPVRFVQDEEIDRFSPGVIKDIGEVAYQRSFLGMTSGDTYRPQPWLLDALAQQTYRAAVALRKDAEAQNKEKQAASSKKKEDARP